MREVDLFYGERRLSNEGQADTPTDRQTGRHTNRQTDRHTNRQTDRQTDTPTDRQTYRQTNEFMVRLHLTSDKTVHHLFSLCRIFFRCPCDRWVDHVEVVAIPVDLSYWQSPAEIRTLRTSGSDDVINEEMTSRRHVIRGHLFWDMYTGETRSPLGGAVLLGGGKWPIAGQ